jgi:hypothetical protein
MSPGPNARAGGFAVLLACAWVAESAETKAAFITKRLGVLTKHDLRFCFAWIVPGGLKFFKFQKSAEKTQNAYPGSLVPIVLVLELRFLSIGWGFCSPISPFDISRQNQKALFLHLEKAGDRWVSSRARLHYCTGTQVIQEEKTKKPQAVCERSYPLLSRKRKFL